MERSFDPHRGYSSRFGACGRQMADAEHQRSEEVIGGRDWLNSKVIFKFANELPICAGQFRKPLGTDRIHIAAVQ